MWGVEILRGIATVCVVVAAATCARADGAQSDTKFDPASPEKSGFGLVFSDDFSKDSIGLDGADNAIWFRQGFFGWKATPSEEVVVSDGALHIKAQADHTAAVQSATPARTEQGWVGRTFSGPAYFEARIRLAPDIGGKNAWPAFWAMAVEHMAGRGADHWLGQPAGYARFIEDDFFEKNEEWGLGTGYAATLHDWYGIWKRTCISPAYCQIGNQSFAHQGSAWIIPADPIDWRQYHVVGQLIEPATQGHWGSVTNYLDGVHVGKRTYWKSEVVTHPPATGWAEFNIVDQQKMVLILSSGTREMDVDYVRVWQPAPSEAANVAK